MKNFFALFWLLFFCVGCFANKETTQNNNQPISNSIASADFKTYAQMSDEEKKKFISEQADKIQEKFGRVEGDQISNAGLASIRREIDGYVARASQPKFDSCVQNEFFKSDLASVLTRGSKYAKTIRDEFSNEGVDSQTGIYIAMLESEFCNEHVSSVGPTGMFQLTYYAGQHYGLETIKGATPQNPDERFNPRLSARAAAKYIKFMAGKYFSTQMNSTSYLLAIASYNSGEGATKTHIKAVTESKGKSNVTFWNLSENADLGGKQFQVETFRYVPKFFAAVIVGENPKVFGIDTVPLSQSN